MAHSVTAHVMMLTTRLAVIAGTLLGVFIPCLQNILGAIFFVRLSWIVAVQGIRNSLIVVGCALLCFPACS